ncbi:YIP1 family protein [Epilithonimonas sp. JDS]|uniref:YIP1 family protein n=1 Tax=Epilithonimonas sp. JDS TaxID=2902797 RepID=UPI001E617B39|nr:YIP1 family protein [Epilithonimonas sp. JDS]MCD9856172.1 YIP1 family protein [Epilithonimonas sp. JDS]
MTWKTIFNPFEKFDEKKLLLIGIIFFILNFFGCFYAGMINDSIFHLSILEEGQTIWDIVRINSLSYIFAIVVLIILAKFFNKRSRIIDIFNTILISQIPLIITMPMMALPFVKEANRNISSIAGKFAKIEMLDLIIVAVAGCITLPFLVYNIVLYYNGFKTATNIKKWQHIVIFAVVSLITTIISQTIF